LVEFTNANFPLLEEMVFPVMFWVGTTVSVGESKLDQFPKESFPLSLKVRLVELELEAGLDGHRFWLEEFSNRLRAPEGVMTRTPEAVTGEL
jgi:hypothetical protein